MPSGRCHTLKSLERNNTVLHRVLFGADLNTGGEGVFLVREAQITELARSGGADLAGGVCAFAFLGLVSLSDRGDPAPGGDVYRDAFSPMLNNVGDIVFLADLTPVLDALQMSGVFLLALSSCNH